MDGWVGVFLVVLSICLTAVCLYFLVSACLHVCMFSCLSFCQYVCILSECMCVCQHVWSCICFSPVCTGALCRFARSLPPSCVFYLSDTQKHPYTHSLTVTQAHALSLFSSLCACTHAQRHVDTSNAQTKTQTKTQT